MASSGFEGVPGGGLVPSVPRPTPAALSLFEPDPQPARADAASADLRGGRVGIGRVPARRRNELMLAALLADRRTFVQWLAHRYEGLSLDDCEDLVMAAIGELDLERVPDLSRARAYLYRVLYRDALDELRHRHGRVSATRAARPAPVSLDELPEGAQPRADDRLSERLAREGEVAAARATAERVLAALSEEEAEVLRARDLDELQAAEASARLGMSRATWARRLPAARRRALEVLARQAPHRDCDATRARMARDDLPMPEARAVEAHREDCVHCRAFAECERSGVMVLLLPALVALEWLRTRIGGLAGGMETPAAGALLGGGVVVKATAVCSSAAAIALCVGAPGLQPRRGAADHRAADRHPPVQRARVDSAAIASSPAPISVARAPARPAVARPAPVSPPRPPRLERAVQPRRPEAAELGFERAGDEAPPAAIAREKPAARAATVPSSPALPAAQRPSRASQQGCELGFERC